MDERNDWASDWVSWATFVEEGQKSQIGRTPTGEIEWNRGSFDAPLWILFSSGTTGRPKYVPTFLLYFP